MTRMRVAIGCTMALAASTMIAGCQTHSADKAGGDTTVLTLATIDEVNDNGQSYGPQEDAMTKHVARDSSKSDKSAVETTRIIMAIALGRKLGAKRRNRTAERNPETATPVDLAH